MDYNLIHRNVVLKLFKILYIIINLTDLPCNPCHSYYKKSFSLNLEERFALTDKALDAMKFRDIKPPIKLFESKLRLQIRLDDFR